MRQDPSYPKGAFKGLDHFSLKPTFLLRRTSQHTYQDLKKYISTLVSARFETLEGGTDGSELGVEETPVTFPSGESAVSRFIAS